MKMYVVGIACMCACLAVAYGAEQYVTQFTIREPKVSGDALHAAIVRLLSLFNCTDVFTIHTVV
jgi:hypothetical protein